LTVLSHLFHRPLYLVARTIFVRLPGYRNRIPRFAKDLQFGVITMDRCWKARANVLHWTGRIERDQT